MICFVKSLTNRVDSILDKVGWIESNGDENQALKNDPMDIKIIQISE